MRYTWRRKLEFRSLEAVITRALHVNFWKLHLGCYTLLNAADSGLGQQLKESRPQCPSVATPCFPSWEDVLQLLYLLCFFFLCFSATIFLGCRRRQFIDEDDRNLSIQMQGVFLSEEFDGKGISSVRAFSQQTRGKWQRQRAALGAGSRLSWQRPAAAVLKPRSKQRQRQRFNWRWQQFKVRVRGSIP
ncbi:hypothetical protein WN944_006985 [Citrus x changshan-huyou]|uniref:Uncharacterized protein n=1 Tax=Citrus x changshan-huyou TaxID=2935761 RepID=A0AAP0QXN0_9ROSI